MPLADIIIVEDNPAIREALAEYLLDEGFAVRTASDGTALDLLLQARTADTLILDLNLPHENGYAIAKRVRQSFPAIGVLILSARGKGDPSDPQAALADLHTNAPLKCFSTRQTGAMPPAPLGVVSWPIPSKWQARYARLQWMQFNKPTPVTPAPPWAWPIWR